MARSIVSEKEECWACKTQISLHRHHIYFGSANRKLSEEDGCWIWLCARHHNMSDFGIHFDRAFDLGVKRICQERWEAIYGDREAFRKRYGKSYL